MGAASLRGALMETPENPGNYSWRSTYAIYKFIKNLRSTWAHRTAQRSANASRLTRIRFCDARKGRESLICS